MLNWLREFWLDYCEGLQTLKELNIYYIPTAYGVVLWTTIDHKEKSNESNSITLV
jgi:hypothetical protein